MTAPTPGPVPPAGPVPPPHGGYVQAYEAAGRLLFVSGQIPVGPDGTVPDGVTAQARQVWANLRAVLASHGAAVSDLVKVTTYLADRGFVEETALVRREALDGHEPALTVVIAGIVDESWLLEIEGVAVLPAAGSGEVSAAAAEPIPELDEIELSAATVAPVSPGLPPTTPGSPGTLPGVPGPAIPAVSPASPFPGEPDRPDTPAVPV